MMPVQYALHLNLSTVRTAKLHVAQGTPNAQHATNLLVCQKYDSNRISPNVPKLVQVSREM